MVLCEQIGTFDISQTKEGDGFVATGTLCWRCVNSIPGLRTGCSWSREFIPVEGWMAVEKTRVYDGHPRLTYSVILCPDFVEEPYRDLESVSYGG